MPAPDIFLLPLHGRDIANIISVWHFYRHFKVFRSLAIQVSLSGHAPVAQLGAVDQASLNIYAKDMHSFFQIL
jgi:hypothetical protein